MLVFEEIGLKNSFKVFLNSKGIIIKSKGMFGMSYNEIYSNVYTAVRNYSVTSKFLHAELFIDGHTITFTDGDEANMIVNLIKLGKINPALLLRFIGTDSSEYESDHIDIDELENAVTSASFTKMHSSPDDVNSEQSLVGMSDSATLDHIINMRMKKIQNAQGASAAPVDASPAPAPSAATPPPMTPPTVGSSCFSFHAYIEGKQQGPYDEKQFTSLVQYGLIQANTPVWREGMAQWLNACDVPETRKFFMQAPPMPPTPPTPPMPPTPQG